MIGTEGQYVFTYKLENAKDFITENSFRSFVLSREAGGGLPTFYMTFETNQIQILRYLNEGNLLTVSLGITQKNAKETKLRLLGEPEISRLGNDKYLIKVSGIYAADNYFTGKSFISDKESGIAVLNKRAELRGFSLNKDNLKTSLDSQCWVQLLLTDRRYFTHLLLHSDLPNDSFPVMAITSKGELRVFDFVKHVKKGYRYRLTQSVSKSNDIVYSSDIVFPKDKSNILNFWLGYLSDKPVLDLVEGGYITYTEDVKNLLSINKDLPRLISEEKRTEELGTIDDFVHKNYWRAYQRNLKSLVLFSRHKLGVNISKIYRDIEPLDIMQFIDSDIGNSESSNPYLSGNYITTKVVESIVDRQYGMYLEMTREGMNEHKGNLK